ncbi:MULTISPECIES: hypothetical protein [unclassified Nocardia]|uniref:hypothetical protein n=1 Tax=unclassified Nocardia TaxID=2637762 RepID=UPI001CE444D9|nr:MULTISPECIES: hypothetical protein [unclassified Nocardia]
MHHEGPRDSGADLSGDNSSSADGPDLPEPQAKGSRYPTVDPTVDSVWLGRRSPARHPGWPRLSTVLLVAAFIAVLVIYFIVQPGG